MFNMAKFHLGQKPAIAGLALLLASGSASAQEVLIAVRTQELAFPEPGVTGFPEDGKADAGQWIRTDGEYEGSGSGLWTAALWVVLDAEWHEDNPSVTAIRVVHSRDSVFASSYVVTIDHTAITRQVFIGGSARTAYLAKQLGAFNETADLQWDFWGNDAISVYSRVAEWFVMQIRVASVDDDGGDGIVVQPPGGGLENPDDFSGFDIDKEFSDFDGTFQSKVETLGDQLPEYWSASGEAGYLRGTQKLSEWAVDYEGNPEFGGAEMPSLLATIPLPNGVEKSFNLTPLQTGATIGGSFGSTWGTTLLHYRQGIRNFLLLSIYAQAVRRILHLVTV